jgi:hypothetical protein
MLAGLVRRHACGWPETQGGATDAPALNARARRARALGAPA